MLREVRALLAHRQPALVYLVGLAVVGTGLDLAVVASRHLFHSFSSFSRLEFDGVVQWRAVAALGHSAALVWVVLALSLAVGAAITGWLRACSLIALADGHYSWRAPRQTVLRLTGYSLLYEAIVLGLTGLGDDGQVAPALLILLLTTPVTLYADYAIVVDDVPIVEGVRRSIAVFRTRLAASLLVTFFLLIFLPQLADSAFHNGFTDATHVQASYLVAWSLVGVLLQFAGDVVLLTLYRDTRLSEAGSAGPPEASRPPGASG